MPREENFREKRRCWLEAVGISTTGKAAEAVHTEFQTRGDFFLAHVLECPLEDVNGLPSEAQRALKARLPAMATRIRRSLKPKRVMAVTEALTPVVEDVLMLDLGSPLLLDNGKPFRLGNFAEAAGIEKFREVLAGRRQGTDLAEQARTGRQEHREWPPKQVDEIFKLC